MQCVAIHCTLTGMLSSAHIHCVVFDIYLICDTQVAVCPSY